MLSNTNKLPKQTRRHTSHERTTHEQKLWTSEWHLQTYFHNSVKIAAKYSVAPLVYNFALEVTAKLKSRLRFCPKMGR